MGNLKLIVSIFVSVSLSIFTSSNTLAQNIAKFEKVGEKEFVNENFAEALEAYQKVLEAEPKNKVALYRAEICSLLTYYPTKPLDDLRKYAKSGGRGDKFYSYWLGRINLKKHNFEEATTYLNKFMKLKQYKSPEIIEETNEFLRISKNAQEFYSDESIRYKVDHLDDHINTKMDELSPTVCSDDHLIFISSKSFKDINHKLEKFEVYQSTKSDLGWATPVLESSFGKFDFENESLSAFDNGNKIAFADFTNNGSLKMSAKKDGKWSKAVLLDQSLGKLGIVSRFCLSNDGKRLIFSSNKFNKREDLDLYEIRKDANGKWGEPINLGSMINSDFDEYSPYITADGRKLYFSSRGHGSVGGYDVFYAELSKDHNRWLPPVQLEYPINTVDDDIHFVLDQQEGGYVASDRYGTKGGFDLFHVSIIQEPAPMIAKVTETAEPERNVNLDIYGDRELHEVANEPKKENKSSTRRRFDTNRLKIIYFRLDEYTLDDQSRKYLNQVSSILKQSPSASLEISSHTDDMGSKEVNDRISRLRAESVLNYLRLSGVTNKLTIKAFGAEMPLASNDDELEGRQLNRRVELVLLK